MNPARWQQIKTALSVVLDHPTTERSARLAAVCGEDTDLCREVRSLLVQQERGGAATALDRFADDFASHLRHDPADALVGRLLGPYRLVRLIGTGGMGAVYLGERADRNYEKRVAVKLIKRGMDTDATLRRFHTERRVLARLDHPHITRLFDGGSTPDGLPYFVMEYVEGIPITRCAEQQKLSLGKRLQLFCQVCAAVHFAHQRLVIHRDLKPGNILVTPEGEPRLMDFGVAKLLDPAPDDDDFAPTVAGQCPVTPAYASPEQMRGEAITTASDVYALGALLYEMLAGSPAHAVAGLPVHEAAPIVCEQEPVRPSAVAGRRELRGDLDNIVLKAMSKEPARRYLSAAQLAADVGRYLEGLPVIARKDTLPYRTRKFIRRHTAGTAAAAAVALALLGGTVTTAWQAYRAEQERARAERRFNDVRRLADSFLFELDDEIEKGPTHARKVLVDCASTYLRDLAREAVGDRSLQRELATAYQKLGDVQSRLNGSNVGDTAGAMQSYRTALGLRESLLDGLGPHPDTVLRMELSSDYLRVGDMLSKTGHSAESLAHDARALALLEGAISNGDDQALNLRLVSGHVAVGRAQVRTGNLDGAALQYEQARRLLSLLVAGEHGGAREVVREQTRVDQSTGFLATLRGHWQEALADYRRNESVWQNQLESGRSDVTTKRLLMDCHEWVALALRDVGDLAGALGAHREALALCQEALAEDPTNIQANNDLADVSHEVGNTLLAQGDAAGAQDCYHRASEHYALVAAADSANVHAQRQRRLVEEEIADALALSGDLSGALAKRQEDLASWENLTRIDPANVEFQRDLALCLEKIGQEKADLGDPIDAGLFLHRALPLFEQLLATSPTNAVARNDLARVCFALGRMCQQAVRAKAAGVNPADGWREASRWYHRSLELWQALQTNEIYVVLNRQYINEVSAALKQIDDTYLSP